MSSGNFSWAPPDLSSLNFHNCTLASEYAVVFWRTKQLPLALTTNLLRDGLSTYLVERNLSPPADWEILRWATDMVHRKDFTIVNAMDSFTSNHCVEDVCPRMGWQGNPDLAGSGMFATYVIQAVLTTIYFIVLAAKDFDKIPPSAKKSRILSSGLLAIELSARPFLDCTLFLSISMLVACLHVLKYSFGNNDNNLYMTLYSSGMVTAVSFYSYLPAVILHVFLASKLRRPTVRATLWHAIGVLIISITIKFMVLYTDDPIAAAEFNLRYLADLDLQFHWSALCIDRDVAVMLKDFLIVFISVSLVFWACCSLWYWSLRCSGISKKCATLYKYWKIFTATVALIAMWICLGFLAYFRRQFGRRGGNTNKDYKLSFGQILALATCAPVIVELLYVWILGPRESLDGQLLKPSHVVFNPDTDSEPVPAEESQEDGMELHPQAPSQIRTRPMHVATIAATQ